MNYCIKYGNIWSQEKSFCINRVSIFESRDMKSESKQSIKKNTSASISYTQHKKELTLGTAVPVYNEFKIFKAKSENLKMKFLVHHVKKSW